MLPVEKRDSQRGEQKGSAALGGEGGAARPETRLRSDGYRYTHPHNYDTKRKAVRLYLEESMPAELVARELVISKGCVFDWVRQYRERGEAGLRPKGYGYRTVNTPDAVAEKITALKKNNPHFGSKRISQILRRLFLLKASPETVRKRLKKAGLGTKAKKARKPPQPKVHYFERTAPNETWQTDITIVNMLGRPAYIIGFIDDYSRYIVGHGVFRSQTAENVMEVYRTAVAQYGPPKEMLTDNGRQYANWRGMTKFQKELKKDKVHHIRSQPHHPQTLGKIERFWKTLKEDYLERARFETFEEVQDRIKYWIKYYNHKRPHQGIEGLCPADRYFSIRKEMKEVIEKGVEQNVEELALRGVPTAPFYMVGQMGEQSVVIRADKGKLKMTVGGEEDKEMVYDLGKDRREDGRESSSEIPEVESVQREGEVPGGTGGVVRAENAEFAVPGTEHELGFDQRLGEKRPGRHDAGAGSGVEQGGTGRNPAGEADRGPDREDGTCGTTAGSASELKEIGDEDRRTGKDMEGGREVPGSAGNMDGTHESGGSPEGDGDKRESLDSVAGPRDGRDAGGVGTAADEGSRGRSGAGEHGEETAGQEGAVERNGCYVEAGEEGAETGGKDRDAGIVAEREEHGSDNRERSEGNGETAAGSPGAGRPDEGHGGVCEDGGEPQDILQVGEACAFGHEGVPAGERLRAARKDSGYGEGGSEAGDRGVEEGAALAGAEASYP